jgi:hypothetical protein
MAKGDKPAIRISARHKNAQRGAKVSVELLAGWNSERGGMNFQLDREVDRIVMKDGTVITSGDYWINGRTFGSVGGERPSTRGTEEGTGTGAPMKDPNDIPF